MMFNLSLPYYDRHPLFRLEVRHIRWGQSPRQLRRYSYWVIGTIVVVALVVLVFWFTSIPYWLLRDFSRIIVQLIYVSIGVNVILDMTCFVFTLNSIDARNRKVWWELLWLTPPGGKGVIIAKYAIAQVSAWRVMIVIVGIRIATIMFVLTYFVVDWLTNINEHINADTILSMPMWLVLVGTYLIEPLWRMRTMTALGLEISARIGNILLAGLTAFGTLIVVWVGQFTFIGLLSFIVIMINLFLFRMDNSFTRVCESFGIGVIFALGIYYYYRVLGKDSLSQALHHAFRE